MLMSTSVVGRVSARTKGWFGSDHNEVDDPVSREYPNSLVSVRSSLLSTEDCSSLVFGGKTLLAVVLLARFCKADYPFSFFSTLSTANLIFQHPPPLPPHPGSVKFAQVEALRPTLSYQ